MCSAALKAPSRTYVCSVMLSEALQAEKFLTSIYMPRISKGDTDDVRGSQRHIEAVVDVNSAGGAQIDKSTAPK